MTSLRLFNSLPILWLLLAFVARSGGEEVTKTSAEGYVRQWKFDHTSHELTLQFTSGEASTTAVVRTSGRPAQLDQLMLSKVRVTGSIAAVGTAEAKGALIAPTLEHLEILTPGSGSSFDAPLVTMSEIKRGSFEPGARVKVRGVVLVQRDHQVYLRGEDGAQLNSLQPPWERLGASADEIADAGPWPELKPGDEVEMVGSVGMLTNYSLNFGDVRVTGKEGRIADPEQVDVKTMKSGRFTNDWVSIEGRIAGWSLQDGHMLYALYGVDDTVTLRVPGAPANVFPKNLFGAKARFTGVALHRSGSTNFYVPDPSYVQILQPGTVDFFDVPGCSAADIVNDRVPRGQPVTLKGRIIGLPDAPQIYVRCADAALNLHIQLPWSRPTNTTGMFFADCGPLPELRMGDEVEIMGWAVRMETYPQYAACDLHSTNIRVLSHQEKAPPVTTTFARIAAGEHTSDFVQVRGRLLTMQVTPVTTGQWGTTMLLKSGGTKMTAVHQSNVLHPFDTLKADDDILIHAVVDRATAHTPRRLRLLSPADAKSLGLSPEVITLRLWIWGGLAAAGIGILGGWVLLLRRSQLKQASVTAELKAANDAAQESEQRWRLLFDQSPLSVQIFAPDGQTKRFNQSWKNLFRLNDEQGYAFNVLKAPDLIASGAVNHIRKAFEGQVVQVPPVPYPIPGDPPETRWIGGVLYPVKTGAGEIAEVVVIHHDITESKRAAEALMEINQLLEKRVEERTFELQKTQVELQRALDQERELGELKSRFVTMVSHEFRTPLGIIMSAVELLQHYSDRLPDDEKQRQLQEIQSSTKHMGGLMEQVLLLGRAEAGKLTCKPLPLDLACFAERIIDETQSISNRKCPITLQTEGEITNACADEALLRHILGNLIANAVKYSPAGCEVVLRIHRKGNEVLFDVIDRGIGIPEKDRARLFEAFHRCSNVGDTPGTGLGLVIVKRCVDLHGGTMDVASEPGSGTTFTVHLPIFY